MFDQPTLEGVIDLDLNGGDLRCLFVLMGRCTWANQVHIQRKALADRLGIRLTHLWKTLRNLRDKRVIWFSETDRAAFAIDPRLCWRGAPHERHAAQGRYNQLFAIAEGDSLQ